MSTIHEKAVEMGLSADVKECSEPLMISILLYQVTKRTLQFSGWYSRLLDHLPDPWKRTIRFPPYIGYNGVLYVFPGFFLFLFTRFHTNA